MTKSPQYLLYVVNFARMAFLLTSTSLPSASKAFAFTPWCLTLAKSDVVPCGVDAILTNEEMNESELSAMKLNLILRKSPSCLMFKAGGRGWYWTIYWCSLAGYTCWLWKQSHMCYHRFEGNNCEWRMKVFMREKQEKKAAHINTKFWWWSSSNESCIYQSVCLSVYTSISHCLTICLFFYICISMSASLSIYLSNSPLSLSLSIVISISCFSPF